MATPTAAEHRDLEQRLRDLEAQVADLTSAALRRKQLAVTEGDFEVSGGGDVVVRDGGQFKAEHEDSATNAVVVGPFYDGGGRYVGAGLLVERPDGQDILQVHDAQPEDEDNLFWGSQVHLYDREGDRIFRDDPGGKGIGSPDLAMPIYRASDFYSTTSGSYQSAYWGGGTLWQPRIDAMVYVTCAAGHAGTVRLVANGGLVQAKAFNANLDGWIGLSGLVPQFSAGDPAVWEIQLQSSTGGQVTVRPQWVRGAAS